MAGKGTDKMEEIEVNIRINIPGYYFENTGLKGVITIPKEVSTESKLNIVMELATRLEKTVEKVLKNG